MKKLKSFTFLLLIIIMSLKSFSQSILAQKEFNSNEFEIFYKIGKTNLKQIEDYIINQWADHAKTINKNPNCITKIENQFKNEINKNAYALIQGIPFQTQINYSDCKIEKFIADTINNQTYSSHLMVYHISACFDPNNRIESNQSGPVALAEKPLVVTYRVSEENKIKWSGYDHNAIYHDRDSEEKIFEELMYDRNTLIFLCEQKDHRIYEIKNTTKPVSVIYDVFESLVKKGIDILKCSSSANPLPTFYGRHQTSVEFCEYLELRYILVNTNSKNFILLRINNRHLEMDAEINFSKGINSEDKKYTIPHNGSITLRLDEMAVFEVEYKIKKTTYSTTRSGPIEFIRRWVGKQITIEKENLNIRNTAMGVRG